MIKLEQIQLAFIDGKEAISGIEKDKKELQGSFPDTLKKSPAALKNFYMARLALVKAGEKVKGTRPKLAWTNIVNHHYLSQDPKLICSLSHTDNCAIAALSSLDEYRSVGVDIECATRVIPANSQKWFKNGHDSSEWSDLELWVIKEACFKSVHPFWRRLHFNQNLVISELIVEHQHFYFYNLLGEEISGQFHTQKINYQGIEYIIAIAIMEKENRVCY